MDYIGIVGIIISSLSLILFLLFFITIRKNEDNIFFSMRSSNLMQITNISIFFSILSYSINNIFYDKFIENVDKNKIIGYFCCYYFVFQIILFFSLVFRYHRLYACSKINLIEKEEILQSKGSEIKYYNYEYFYVRAIAIIIFLVLIISGLLFILVDYYRDCFMFSYEIIEEEDIVGKNYYFWSIFSFIETFTFLNYAIFIIKAHLSPNVKIELEIIIVTLINYFYFFIIGIETFEKDIIDEKILPFIPFLYNLLIYLVTLGLPFIWGRNNKTIINYDLPGDLVSSLYLFLTKEKGYDLFHKFLYEGNERDKGIFYLDMLINIFKYRFLIINEEPYNSIIEEIDNIDKKFLNKTYNYFEDDLVKKTKKAIQENIDNPKINIFDPITNVIYDYLEKKFNQLTRTEEFDSLKNDLTEETYVRCNLANYGLIRI